MKIGIIGGTGLLNSSFFSKGETKTVSSEFGKATLICTKQAVFLQRHGKNIPPHQINHRANITALKQLGISKIMGIGSCGSLHKSINPGIIIIPHDYINFARVITFFDKGLHFTVPGMSNDLRNEILDAAKLLNLSIITNGVYLQTRGPRLETPAEIRMFAQFADIIGMTLANEMTLCKEIGLEYAAICSVDNYCNGLLDEPLHFDDIARKTKQTRHTIEKLINQILTQQ